MSTAGFGPFVATKDEKKARKSFLHEWAHHLESHGTRTRDCRVIFDLMGNEAAVLIREERERDISQIRAQHRPSEAPAEHRRVQDREIDADAVV